MGGGYCVSWVRGGKWEGAPVPDEPKNKLRPSGNARSLPLARCDPSFAWYPSTTTSVPGSRDSLVNPRRKSTFGVPASTAQFSTVPSGFFTSTCIQVWGLTHSIFVMVPLKLTGLFASNSAAKAWCADTDAAPPHIARPATTTAVASFLRIDFSLLPRFEPGWTPWPAAARYPDSGYSASALIIYRRYRCTNHRTCHRKAPCE